MFETLRGISELVLKRLAVGGRGRVTVTLQPAVPLRHTRRGRGQPAGRDRGARRSPSRPGTVYNPLFIYARPGLGKTHLLMAIGHAARSINPELVVEYLTLDEFVEAFHAAIAAGHGEAYRKRFLDVDLLLVDDVQFLTHRREMQASCCGSPTRCRPAAARSS